MRRCFTNIRLRTNVLIYKKREDFSNGILPFLLYNQENSREKYFPAKRGETNMKGTSCEYCANYTYDEECDEYYCDVNLDEDEYYRFVSSDYKECPYYRSGDEYKVVRHQM